MRGCRQIPGAYFHKYLQPLSLILPPARTLRPCKGLVLPVNTGQFCPLPLYRPGVTRPGSAWLFTTQARLLQDLGIFGICPLRAKNCLAGLSCAGFGSLFLTDPVPGNFSACPMPRSESGTAGIPRCHFSKICKPRHRRADGEHSPKA